MPSCPTTESRNVDRRRWITVILAAGVFALVGACSDEGEETVGPGANNVAADAGGDAGDASADLPEGDDVSPDTADTTEDTGAATVPLDGFGQITGECGVIDLEEIDSASPFLFRNAINFADPYTDALFGDLSEGGQEVFNDGNAGGSSLDSEVFAFEVLHRCELAALLKTETEVVYATSGTITDLLVTVDGRKLGVSVTRAVGWPRDQPWTVEQATALLTDKLLGVQASTANVAPEDAWDKQILHIIAYAPGHADSVAAAYGGLDPSVVGDTIVYVTVSDGQDEWIYE
jgi:hypothetical protein